MITFAVTLEDLKEMLRESIDKGFELVAGAAGAKIAKSVEGAVKNAEFVAGGYEDIAGLREQIKENAIILLPLMDERAGVPICSVSVKHSDDRIRVIRANLPYNKPRVVFWSTKQGSITAALKNLLDVTQGHLKLHLSALMDPPSPAVGNGGWARTQFHSFENMPTTTEPSAGATTAEDDAIKILWSANAVTNPSFQQAGGFDYGSFDSGFDTDDATYVDPVTITKA